MNSVCILARAPGSWTIHTEKSTFTLFCSRSGLCAFLKSRWSLSVIRNRRLTFRIDTAEREICDANLAYYH